MMDNLISIGKIINFHGIKGEVKVAFTKGRDAQMEASEALFVKKDKEFIKLDVEQIRFHKGFALIKFKQLNSINDVEEVKGCILFLEKDFAGRFLEEDEFFIDDLIGAEVFEFRSKKFLGVVASVTSTEGNDLFSVKNPKNRLYYVPFVKALVPFVDVANKRIEINNIEGLVDEV